MKKINVGILGKGHWGKKIYSKIKKDVNIIFFLGNDKIWTSLIKYVDWIIVATPNKTHYDIVKKCILRKKNVFCEKPLALKFSQVKYLYKISKHYKTKLYCSDIENFKKKNIKIKNKNTITREKKSYTYGDILYRLAYHDFTYLYSHLKNKKFKIIVNYYSAKKTNFIIKYSHLLFHFKYSLNSKKKVHLFNQYSLMEKKDQLKKMLLHVLYNKIDFSKNELVTKYASKMITTLMGRINFLKKNY